jgi:acetyltransferase-like isoleucine patch superfamily enzyme
MSTGDSEPPAWRTDGSVEIGQFTYGVSDVHIWDSGNDTGPQLRIGSFCSIAENVSFLVNADHHTEYVTTFPFEDAGGPPRPRKTGPIVVGNDVWIGYGSTVLGGVTIGDGAVIAAGAVVASDVEPYCMQGGVPARKIRLRFDPDIIERLLRLRWWDWPLPLIQAAVPILTAAPTEHVLNELERMEKAWG